MKKLLYLVVAISMVVMVSCSKDKKINKQLSGDWNVTKMDGEAPAAGESYKLTFDKTEKTSGTGTMAYTSSFGTYSYPFTYSIADEKISMTTTYTIGTTTSTQTTVSTVTEHSKTKFVITDADGDVTEMEKI